jgi:hypothetical protein
MVPVVTERGRSPGASAHSRRSARMTGPRRPPARAHRSGRSDVRWRRPDLPMSGNARRGRGLRPFRPYWRIAQSRLNLWGAATPSEARTRRSLVPHRGRSRRFIWSAGRCTAALLLLASERIDLPQNDPGGDRVAFWHQWVRSQDDEYCRVLMTAPTCHAAVRRER